MDWALAALFCCVLAGVGAPWVPPLAGRRPPLIAWAGLGYLTGAAQVTAGLLGAALLGMPINRLTLGLVAAAWLLLGLGVLHRSASLGSITPLVGGDIRAAIPVLVVAVIGLGYIGVTVANGPIDSIDFIGFWGKRGVAMFIDHNLDFHLIHDKDHTYYPLELSNLYGSVDILLGHVNDQVIRLPLAAFAAALAASTWWLCRLAMPPLAAALAVALPITTQQYAASTGSGLADMVMTAYVTVCGLACFLWVRDDDPRWAALAGVAAGGAAWTKIEGTPTAAVILLTAVLLRRRISRDVFVAFVLFAFFVIPWFVFRRLHHIPDAPNQFSRVDLRIVWIVTRVWHHLLFATGVWGAFWWICLTVIVLALPFWWRSDWRYLAALTLPNLVLTMGAYVVTYSRTSGAITVTVHRLYLHLVPLVAVLTSAAALTAWSALARSVPISGASHLADPQPDRRS